jgi:SAM-dependent methyltransferase
MTFTLLKEWIKEDPARKRASFFLIRFLSPLSPSTFIKGILNYWWFIRDLLKFRSMGGRAELLDCYPCLFDKTLTTSFDAQYLYQAAWGAKKIYEHRPDTHFDIGSHLSFVTQLAAFTKVDFIDIRPADITIDGFRSIPGSITKLPLQDASISSISSMHVIEHIGLGRYGDPLQVDGPLLACKEISRVLRVGGRAYISVPIGRARVGFNGLYVFDAANFPKYFDNCRVVDFAYVDCDGSFNDACDHKMVQLRETTGGLDFGLGIYVLEKQ